MRHVISIDPGAVHCGVARWVQGEDELWECEWAKELSPEECVDFVRDQVVYREPAQIVIEGFWLKPGMDAMRQAGSQMETTEVIGVVRHLCRWHGVRFQKVANGQQAIITRLKSAGYEFVSHGNGDHAKDAECVGVRGLELKVRQIRQLAQGRA